MRLLTSTTLDDQKYVFFIIWQIVYCIHDSHVIIWQIVYCIHDSHVIIWQFVYYIYDSRVIRWQIVYYNMSAMSLDGKLCIYYIYILTPRSF